MEKLLGLVQPQPDHRPGPRAALGLCFHSGTYSESSEAAAGISAKRKTRGRDIKGQQTHIN